MTDTEIAADLERVFIELPGMRRCYETWRGIEERICLSDGVPPLSEARCQRAFHRMLCATERRVLEAQARAQRGMAREALALIAETPLEPTTISKTVVHFLPSPDRAFPRPISKAVPPSPKPQAPSTIWMPPE